MGKHMYRNFKELYLQFDLCYFELPHEELDLDTYKLKNRLQKSSDLEKLYMVIAACSFI